MYYGKPFHALYNVRVMVLCSKLLAHCVKSMLDSKTLFSIGASCYFFWNDIYVQYAIPLTGPKVNASLGASPIDESRKLIRYETLA